MHRHWLIASPHETDSSRGRLAITNFAHNEALQVLACYCSYRLVVEEMRSGSVVHAMAGLQHYRVLDPLASSGMMG